MSFLSNLTALLRSKIPLKEEGTELTSFGTSHPNTGVLTRVIPLSKDLAKIVAVYAANIKVFGETEYKNYWGVKAVDAFDLFETPEFLDWWLGNDPVDETKKVWQTHFPPVFCPRSIIENNKKFPFTPKNLGLLMENPLKGHAARLLMNPMVVSRHGSSQENQPCYICMRKDVVGRNLPFDQQKEIIRKMNEEGAGYEIAPRLIHVMLSTFVPYLENKERPLGDETGREKQWVYSRCAEVVRYRHSSSIDPVVVGGFTDPTLEKPGSLDPKGLHVHINDCGNVFYSLACVRIFKPKEKPQPHFH